jgi:beta-lactamase regulating signal transducer with metallopeptidase domain
MNEILEPLIGEHPEVIFGGAFLAANLAAAATIPIVAVARLPLRQRLGPEAAYSLWAAPPFVALLAWIVTYYRLHEHGAWAPAGALWSLWAMGATAVLVVFGVAQMQFLGSVRAGRAGPAVVGLISPRIVMPPDDGSYSMEERDLIRAHEREHVARKDPRATAWAALAQGVCWFNPLVHLAAALIRLDQELICDAAVVRRQPKLRGLYARTLLKTQLAAEPLPFGCYWSARGQHPLEVRMAFLKRRPVETRPVIPGATVVHATRDAIRP